ncbi:YbbR-like domain-containing protein [Lapidilactobacillus achengensis]|uniref:YbbR-like domain-containing protein n=1 Tax=Lapidilactobacillus achengensis TaxID=2486000 RepID=A0ABW1URT1_9LACO|nr:CdaR family protein [Lapidilactobacillus achengensis]
MKDFFNRPWVYRVLSLGLAVLLFVYVQSNNLGSTISDQRQNSEQTAIAQTKTTMRVSLQVEADVEKYFVTGYPEKVDVTISGSKALVASTKNMQNFRAYIDLRDLSTGTHTVKIKISGLSSSLNFSVKPESTKVKIQTRSDRTLPIQVNFNSNRVADGYLVGTPTISPETVRVSGSKSEVKRVKQVVADLDLSANTKANYEQEVMLKALDKNGKEVDVLMSPQTAHVELPISLPTKKLTLSFSQDGDGQDGLLYAFTSSVTQVTVSAPQSVLSDLPNTLTMPIDVSDITATVQKTITLAKPDGVVAIDPKSVAVNIKVTQSNSEGSSSSSSSKSSQSTSSSKSSSSSTSSGSSADDETETDSDSE